VERKVTFCRICEASCGLVAEVESGRVVALEPDREHVVTRGYACVKGTRFTEVHDSPDRLRHPLKRTAHGFQRIGWDEALAEIGAKLRALRTRHGRDSVGMYMGNPAAFSVPHPIFANGLLRGLGTRQLFTAGSQDCANKFAASQAMFGSPMIQPVPDLDRLQCFVIIGSNPAVSQMSFIHAPRPIERLRTIEKRGGKVVFVNPRRTESAEQVGSQLFIRPDTDVFFLLSFAHEVFTQGGVDGGVLRHLEHLDELRAVAQPWPAARTAEVTGIPAETLGALVADFLRARASALYASTGLNQGRHGTLAAWLLNAINAVTGNLDRLGGVLVPRGLVNMPLLSKLAGAGTSTHRSRVGDFAALVDALPAGILADEILTPGEGQLRALIVSAGNPLLSCANGPRLARAFTELELLVSVDMFRNETGNLAHYILPATSFLERDDMPLGMHGFQPVPYLQYTERVVEPDGEQKDEWWIFTRLAEAAGVSMFGSRSAHRYLSWSARGALPSRLAFSPAKLYRAFVQLSAPSRGKPSFEALRAAPSGVLTADNREQDFLGKRTRVLRPGGKVDVAPAAFCAAASALEVSFREELATRSQLKLVSKRERHSHNSWMHNVEAFVKKPRDTNYLYMHPEDAATRGLAEGDVARISSATGSVEARVKHSDDLMPGAVALPHGWGHASAQGLSVARTTSGVNANVLSADGVAGVEPLAGMVHLTGIPVEVDRA
jgi:anaerobic selenocysteine-containing dehydrogenase